MEKSKEQTWDEWGEEFGRKMEAKFCGCGSVSKKPGTGGIVLGLLILAWGAVWLGNDLGWWNVEFPFWPVVIILIALAIIFGELKKAF